MFHYPTKCPIDGDALEQAQAQQQGLQSLRQTGGSCLSSSFTPRQQASGSGMRGGRVAMQKLFRKKGFVTSGGNVLSKRRAKAIGRERQHVAGGL